MRKRTTCRSRCQTGNDDKASCASARHAGRVARRATTIRSHAQAHDMPVASHDGDDDKASCASARRHIASHNGNDDMSYASARYHHIILHHVKATTTTTISDDEQRVLNNEASYASARHISHCAQAHMLCVKHRRNNQPGNVKHRRARATSSNIDDFGAQAHRAFIHRAQAHKLSDIVRKRTSYSVCYGSA